MYLYRSHTENRHPDDCDIVLYQSAYRAVVQHLASDTSRELGGLLLGYEEPAIKEEASKIYITNVLPAKHTQGSAVSLNFTEETWVDFDAEIGKLADIGTGLRRLGWYHSHPGFHIFLSAYDLDVCANFPRPTQVALVVDSIGDTGGFFVRGTVGYRSSKYQGFWEYPDIQGESVVTWKNMSFVRSSLTSQSTLPSSPVLTTKISDPSKISYDADIGYVKEKSTSLIKRDANPIKIMFSYSHKDENLRDELAKHLSLLKWQGAITEWHDRKITASSQWEREINNHLNTAQIILLLISADFLASGYCYSIEMRRALERYSLGEARIIPIILRDVDWVGAPFAEFQALPKDAKPVTSWQNIDEAFADIARGIRKTIDEIRNAQ